MPIFRALNRGLFAKTRGAGFLIEYPETANFPYKSASWRVSFLSGALRTVGAKGGEKPGEIGVRAFRASCGLGRGSSCPRLIGAGRLFFLCILSGSEGVRERFGSVLRFVFIIFIIF